MADQVTAAAKLRAICYGVGLGDESIAELTVFFIENPGADEQAITEKIESLRTREADLDEALTAKVRATASGFSLPYDEAIAQGFSEHPLPTWDEPSQAPILTASVPSAQTCVPGTRARESRPAGSTRRRGPPKRDDDSESDPPRSELARTAAASVRLAAHLARRQRRRLTHLRGSVVA